jgi:hypothetical protein
VQEQPEKPYIPPTREQMKAVVKNPSEPEPVRRHLRKVLYGEGGAGRKAAQQDALQRRKVIPGQHTTDELKRPPGMSGRQWKKLQRTIREGRKVMAKAAEAEKAEGINA